MRHTTVHTSCSYPLGCSTKDSLTKSFSALSTVYNSNNHYTDWHCSFNSRTEIYQETEFWTVSVQPQLVMSMVLRRIHILYFMTLVYTIINVKQGRQFHSPHSHPHNRCSFADSLQLSGKCPMIIYVAIYISTYPGITSPKLWQTAKWGNVFYDSHNFVISLFIMNSVV